MTSGSRHSAYGLSLTSNSLLDILLRSLKADANEICRWLIECDMDKLTLNSLEQFDKALPEDNILGQYQQLKENIEELDPSEQFLVVVSLRNPLVSIPMSTD